MAGPFADYEYYTETYHGSAVAEADFDRLALRASQHVDALTFDRAGAVIEANEDAALIDRIKMATCAVADTLYELEQAGGAVQSERVGNVSVTYVNQQSEAARIAGAAKLHLGTTGLMYRGL